MYTHLFMCTFTQPVKRFGLEKTVLGSFCLLQCLAITTVRSCGDVERREGIANCKTVKKLAEMTTTDYSSFKVT